MSTLKKGIIVDTNAFHIFVDTEHEDSKPIHKCIKNRKLQLVYGDDEQSLKEIKGDKRMVEMIRRLKRGVRRVNSKEKEKEIVDNNRFINGIKLKSEDTHIIAIALLDEKARILFITKEKNLTKDFKNLEIIKPKGHIYKNKSHEHLLH